MRVFVFGFLFVTLFSACEQNRVFEKNEDLKDRSWLVTNKPTFEFMIDDTTLKYNVYCNIRNEVSYEKANIYFTYYLTDSTGAELKKELIKEYLFDKKTGEPLGKSGLGDIYDHRIPLFIDYKFKHPSKYRVAFEQFMRMDTLNGILAVGLRIEKSKTD